MKVALAVNINETKSMLKTYFKTNDIVVSFNMDNGISIHCNPNTNSDIVYNQIAGIKFEGGPLEYTSYENKGYQYHHAKSVADTLSSVL